MDNWILLNEQEYDNIWNKVYDVFNFKPSCYEKDWPTYRISEPYITYDISDSNDYEYQEYHKKGLFALKECTLINEYLYALDWQHNCYWFNPWNDFVRWNEHFRTNDWPIPLYPCGDYYIFLQKDLKWGILTHPWEKSISIFGQNLINSFNNYKPVLFNRILSSNL